MSVEKRLQILCLHGYHQNKDIFKKKIGSFRKPLKKYADFHFIDAPHLLNGSNSQEGTLDSAYLPNRSDNICTDGRGWWFKQASDEKSDGLQESLNFFMRTLEENGPFDGVMGFSQGAAFLALACILLQDKLSSSSVKFVIFVAGFKSHIPFHTKFYDTQTKINIPSLHVIGDTDEVISSSRSRELLELFDNSEVVTHPGGHYVPATKDLKVLYKLFIVKFVTTCA
ncbi:esterase OVCA2 [Homalodisca vitripennis]|uniref:esterase OVCA2 n=1 Tax=Homalodisca vitripennis TaxID=197043 RepID=UPI001EEB3442|nr:esterase OVCA2 [Homalodisca vitripennis]